MLGPEESSRAIPPLAELLAIRRIESIYHKNARPRHPSAKERPFSKAVHGSGRAVLLPMLPYLTPV